MINFLQENAILILAIAGAITSYFAVINDKIMRKKRWKSTLTLATIGFVIVVGQQVVNHVNKRHSALIEDARTRIVDEIRQYVS